MDALQILSWKKAHGRLRSDNRSETRLLTLTIPVPADHRLCYDDLGGSEVEWNSVDTLETVGNLDFFVDDPALLSYAQQQMQVKTNMVVDNSGRLGITINRAKSNVLKTTVSNNTSITVQI
ncbi:hypothetical protein DPMN_116917 [Dreissena polymorpha]|uniref:Uncharacterized protein n=1 Tax=Dreissena polymorpha TaxID=45954 RepID=A0A9D4KQQ2_DREPO|nr:hypothetical protein DPMN_116917 [Dreissena polymorpha]